MSLLSDIKVKNTIYNNSVGCFITTEDNAVLNDIYYNIEYGTPILNKKVNNLSILNFDDNNTYISSNTNNIVTKLTLNNLSDNSTYKLNYFSDSSYNQYTSYPYINTKLNVFDGFKILGKELGEITDNFTLVINFTMTSVPVTIFQLIPETGIDTKGEIRLNSTNFTNNKVEFGFYNNTNNAIWKTSGGDFSTTRMVNSDNSNTLSIIFSNHNSANNTYTISYDIEFSNGDHNNEVKLGDNIGFNLSSLNWTSIETGDGVTINSLELISEDFRMNDILSSIVYEWNGAGNARYIDNLGNIANVDIVSDSLIPVYETSAGNVINVLEKEISANNFSVSFWNIAQTSPNWRDVIGFTDGNSRIIFERYCDNKKPNQVGNLNIYPSNLYDANNGDATFIPKENWKSTEFQLLTIVCVNGAISGYSNGELVLESGTPINNNLSGFRTEGVLLKYIGIGNSVYANGNSDRNYNQKFADFKVYNTALTPKQVKKLYLSYLNYNKDQRILKNYNLTTPTSYSSEKYVNLNGLQSDTGAILSDGTLIDTKTPYKSSSIIQIKQNNEVKTGFIYKQNVILPVEITNHE